MVGSFVIGTAVINTHPRCGTRTRLALACALSAGLLVSQAQGTNVTTMSKVHADFNATAAIVGSFGNARCDGTCAMYLPSTARRPSLLRCKQTEPSAAATAQRRSAAQKLASIPRVWLFLGELDGQVPRSSTVPNN